MVDEDPDARQAREELVPGWHVPGRTRYDYDLRIGDAERDAAMAQLREHFVAGRLTFDELSERELAVLRLLSSRLSLREIGNELYVSLNTIKTHTRNLYAKLRVGSRQQAVIRARELGLLGRPKAVRQSQAAK